VIPCIWGTDFVVVARFRAAAVLRLRCSPPPAVMTGSASTDIAMYLRIRHQPAAPSRSGRNGHDPLSIDFRYGLGMTANHSIIAGPWIPEAPISGTREIDTGK
jgi:hypothetical protein